MLESNQWQFDMIDAIVELRDNNFLDDESVKTLFESVCLDAGKTPSLDDLLENK